MVQAEEKALMELQRADFDSVIDILVRQGWFVKDDKNKELSEIWRDDSSWDKLKMDKIKIHRKFDKNSFNGSQKLSPDYPKVATKLMFDIMKDLGIHHSYQFTKYDIETFEETDKQKGGKLNEIAKDLSKKAMALYQVNKTKNNPLSQATSSTTTSKASPATSMWRMT